MFLPVETHSFLPNKTSFERTVPAITLAEEQLENDAKDALSLNGERSPKMIK